ncbi:hypothetical protein M514_05849 [Trichuris suis]|uniref:Uncharacterized protein n=1 Tax=Trichuris suis TaxID=68888 RepID=A0A085M822_9BILA|nr:hypothetical protein M513_05849 [Trichuris suis]KFD61165.1 hypothetical protein M514_05849 [Trichuris suis]
MSLAKEALLRWPTRKGCTVERAGRRLTSGDRLEKIYDRTPMEMYPSTIVAPSVPSIVVHFRLLQNLISCLRRGTTLCEVNELFQLVLSESLKLNQTDALLSRGLDQDHGIQNTDKVAAVKVLANQIKPTAALKFDGILKPNQTALFSVLLKASKLTFRRLLDTETWGFQESSVPVISVKVKDDI